MTFETEQQIQIRVDIWCCWFHIQGWKAKCWNLRKSQRSEYLMVCNWLIKKLLPLDLKSAAWPLSSINQGVVYSCLVQMRIVVFLHKWTSSLVSSSVLQSWIVLMTYGSCTSGTVRWKTISFSCWVAGAVGKDEKSHLTLGPWEVLERICSSGGKYARGQKCVEGAPHCGSGAEYWTGMVLAIYGKLCFFCWSFVD